MISTEFKDNSITLFRYIAITQVILGHMQLLGVYFPKWIMIPFSLFQGVPVFFGISGFLIWGSLDRTDKFNDYIKKRFLRIYPELWMGIFLSVLTIVFFYKEKIHWGKLFIFTLTQATFLQFWTPDFLREYGTGTPNGSLWTICTFVQFYLLAYFIHRNMKDWGVFRWIVTIAITIMFDVTYPITGGVFSSETLHKLYGQTIVPYLYLFLIGMLVGRYFDMLVPVLRNIWPLFIGIEIILDVVGINISGVYDPLRTICAILAAIGLSYFIKVKIPIDISYELYIFHGIIINLFIEIGFAGNVMAVLSAIMVSIIISLSVHYLNKKIISKIQNRN